MTKQQRALKRIRSLTLSDIKDNLVTVAERFLSLWHGDSLAARSSLIEIGVNGELAHLLGLAIVTVEHRRQLQIENELDGWKIHRGRYRFVS